MRFNPLPGLNAAQMGRLWALKWCAAYPISEQQPVLAPETFLKTEPDKRPPHPDGIRLWFLSDDRSSMIQVQQDRFIHNWRKTEGALYPRYHDVSESFDAEFGDFVEFLDESELGSLSAVECEVTYVNHFREPELRNHSDLPKFVAPWTGAYTDDFLPTAEDAALFVRHKMSEDPAGLLEVSVVPLFPRSGVQKPIYRLSLTARTQPADSSAESIRRSLDQGHDWVVNGFVSFTTKPMHAIWGKESDED